MQIKMFDWNERKKGISIEFADYIHCHLKTNQVMRIKNHLQTIFNKSHVFSFWFDLIITNFFFFSFMLIFLEDLSFGLNPTLID